MGTYTPNCGFYKPDANEFVNVDSQLNNNWIIADEVVRRCVEWEYTNLQFPDISKSRTPRAKFYRPYSNSLVTYFKQNNTWWQDPTANVSPWTHLSGAMSEGYFEADNF